MSTNSRSVFFAITWIIAVCAGVIARPAAGQEAAPVGKQKPDAKSPARKTADDARSLVESLVDQNPTPKLVDHHEPMFASKFDWNEYERAWKTIPVVVRRAESAWPELVKHLNDERYCTTFASITGYPHNWTVGDACKDIIGRSLSQAYYQKLEPESHYIYARFRWPDFVSDQGKLKVWCEERSNKKLYELQIEACEWAISMLDGSEDLGDTQRIRRTAWSAAVTKEIASLRESKKAVPFAGYGLEEHVRYSKERADLERPK